MANEKIPAMLFLKRFSGEKAKCLQFSWHFLMEITNIA